MRARRLVAFALSHPLRVFRGGNERTLHFSLGRILRKPKEKGKGRLGSISLHFPLRRLRLLDVEKYFQSSARHQLIGIDSRLLDEESEAHEDACHSRLLRYACLQYNGSALACRIYRRCDHNIHLDHIAHYKQKIKNTVKKKTERSLFRFFVSEENARKLLFFLKLML